MKQSLVVSGTELPAILDRLRKEETLQKVIEKSSIGEIMEVVCAVKAFRDAKIKNLALRRKVKEQLSWPDSKVREKVQVRGGFTLLSPQIKAIRDMSRDLQVPIEYFAWIEDRPYPLAKGLMIRTQADERGLKKTETISSEWDGDVAIITKRISFWNGEVYEGVGSSDYSSAELERKEAAERRGASSYRPPRKADIVRKAETNAIRRALLQATGLEMTAEEFEEWRKYEESLPGEVIDLTFKEEKEVESWHIGTLVKKASEEFNLPRKATFRILAALKYSLREFKQPQDFQFAWQTMSQELRRREFIYRDEGNLEELLSSLKEAR